MILSDFDLSSKASFRKSKKEFHEYFTLEEGLGFKPIVRDMLIEIDDLPEDQYQEYTNQFYYWLEKQCPDC